MGWFSQGMLSPARKEMLQIAMQQLGGDLSEGDFAVLGVQKAPPSSFK